MMVFQIKNIVFAISNIAFVLGFYYILKALLPMKEMKQRVVLLFTAFYVINTANYILINNSNLNLLVFLICVASITGFCYEGNSLYKCLIVAIVCGCSFAVEMAVAYLVAAMGNNILKVTLSHMEQTLVIIVLSKFLLLAAGLFLSWMRTPKSVDMELPRYMMMFLLVPISSLLLIICFFIGEGRHSIELRNMLLVLSIVLIFVLNVDIYLLLTFTVQECEKRCLYENELSKAAIYRENHEIQREYTKKMMRYQHDYRKTCLHIRQQMIAGEYDRVMQTIENEIKSIYVDINFVDTGNPEIDHLINHKIAYAESNGIKINSHILIEKEGIPYKINDICVLIENVLDYSIDVCSTLHRNCKILLQIEVISHCFHMTVRHPCVPVYGDKQNSEKKIRDIRAVCEQYHGFLNVEEKDLQLTMDIVLFPN